MPIRIGGTVNVAAPRDEVWDTLFDLNAMREIVGRVPGITLERLEQTDDLIYEATAVIGVAAVKGKYDGKITILERRPPEYVRVKGEGKGGGNWTSGEVALTLNQVEDATQMAYSGLGNLNGPLAGLGQRLVDTVGRQFIDQGAKIFASQIEQQRLARVTPELVPAAPPPPEIGLAFNILFTLLVLGTLIGLIILLTLQVASR